MKIFNKKKVIPGYTHCETLFNSNTTFYAICQYYSMPHCCLYGASAADGSGQLAFGRHVDPIEVIIVIIIMHITIISFPYLTEIFVITTFWLCRVQFEIKFAFQFNN